MPNQFTPGPWLTVKSKPNRVRDESGVIITQVSMPPTKLDKAAWMKGKEISHANARLIAQAPAMLEALEEMIEPGLSGAQQLDAIQNAKAVIAAATGEAP